MLYGSDGLGVLTLASAGGKDMNMGLTLALPPLAAEESGVSMSFKVNGYNDNEIMAQLERQTVMGGDEWETVSAGHVAGKGSLKISGDDLGTDAVLRLKLSLTGRKLDVYQLSYSRIVKSAQTYVALSCDTDGVFDASYRFGFNGQMKDNEIAGTGNHNTAEFWEYDTRLGRRWNLDPVTKEWESSYITFYDNTIFSSDEKGNDAININRKNTSYSNSDGSLGGSSSLNVNIIKCAGKDTYTYTCTNEKIGADGTATVTVTKEQLHPEKGSNDQSNFGTGKSIYLDGLITSDRKMYDYEVIGSLMNRDKGFENYMNGRDPEAKLWANLEVGNRAMAEILPIVTYSAVGAYGSSILTTPKVVTSFEDILSSPHSLWGKSKEEIGAALGDGWTEGKYGSNKLGWKFTNGEKSVFYNKSSSAYGGAEYYGFSTGKLGKNKVVNPATYLHRAGDKAKIHNKRPWQ